METGEKAVVVDRLVLSAIQPFVILRDAVNADFEFIVAKYEIDPAAVVDVSLVLVLAVYRVPDVVDEES